MKIDFEHKILSKVSKWERCLWCDPGSSWPLDTSVPREPSAHQAGIVLDSESGFLCESAWRNGLTGRTLVVQTVFKVKPIFVSLETRKTAIKLHHHSDPVSLNTEHQQFQHQIL